MAKAEEFNLLQFQRKFGTEEACQNYLFEQRWLRAFVAQNVDTKSTILSARASFMSVKNAHIRHQ